MNKEGYQELVNSKKPKEPKFKNACVAFLVGGSLGFLCEVLSYLLMLCCGVSKVISFSIISLILIFSAALLTGLGVFDDLVSKGKMGLIIPTTGFAHGVASSALEFRKDGMITGLGANFFRLAGSVILYGIVSSFFLCLLKVIISG